LLCFVHAQVATELFGGDNWIVLAAVIALPSIGTQYLTWGILAGNRKFRAYGTVNATEGFGRLIGGALLLAFGVRTAGGLSFVIALAPAASVLFVLRTLRGSERQEPDTGRNLKRRVLLWLLGSSLIQAFFINAGPLLIKLLAPSNSSLATGRFLSGLVLVRVPLFLYNAASAALLPPLAVAASRRHWGSFRSQLNRLLVVIGVIAGISVVFVVTLGTWVLGAVFGARYQLDRMTMLALALAASTLLVTTTLSVALTATGAVRYLFACWCSGVGTMLLTLLLFQGLFPRVEFSLLFGASVSAATMAAGLYLRAVPLHARGEVVEAEVLADIARTAEL
jgi:O-antigen/teichoic acid export membrane protein